MHIVFSQRVTALDGDLETPVGLFLRLAGELPGILLESAEVDGRWGRYSIIGTDFLLALSCREGLLDVHVADERLAPLRDCAGQDFVHGLREVLRALRIEGESAQAPITRALYGMLGYGVAGIFDSQSAPFLPPREAEACLVLPASLIVCDHGYNRITRLDLLLNGEKVRTLPAAAAPSDCLPPDDAHPLAAREEYAAAVMRVADRIRRGEAMQVALSAPFSAPLRENPFNLYRRLRREHPSPYMFYMRLPDTRSGVVLGASPEVLVTCEANRLRLCPIADIRPRSRHPAEDILFGDEVLRDPREEAAHAMLVERGRDDLGRIARPGSVHLERFMEVERFSQAMQLTSRIQAELAPGLDALDVLAAIFPAGTVSGVPRTRAMEIIAAEERDPRGPYAGAVGWIGLDNDAVHLDFGIIVRSLWVRGGHVHWRAGASITHDCLPEKTWSECCDKAAVIRQVVLSKGAHCPAVPPANRKAPVSRPPHVRAPIQMPSILEHLAQGRDLAPEEAAAAFARLMDGELSPSQAGALLLGLRAKGESPDEVEEAVKAVLARAIPVPAVSGPVMDIVGTGGDGRCSFNCSTATALTLAGMGYKVLKHGNRSVSSRCGSADVLEQLGVPLDTPPEAVAETLEREGFVFLFAPRYHPAFRHVMPVRRELGLRTLFNILGPLVNPARPTHCFFGVADTERLPLVAEALVRLRPEAGVVVHGAGKFDELTPLGEAALIFVNGDTSWPGRLDPAAYGIAPCTEQELAVEGPEHAADVLRRVLTGQGSRAVADMLTLNLGLALYLFENEKNAGADPDPDCGYNRRRMREAMTRAKDAVNAGAGRRFCHA